MIQLSFYFWTHMSLRYLLNLSRFSLSHFLSWSAQDIEDSGPQKILLWWSTLHHAMQMTSRQNNPQTSECTDHLLSSLGFSIVMLAQHANWHERFLARLKRYEATAVSFSFVAQDSKARKHSGLPAGELRPIGCHGNEHALTLCVYTQHDPMGFKCAIFSQLQIWKEGNNRWLFNPF